MWARWVVGTITDEDDGDADTSLMDLRWDDEMTFSLIFCLEFCGLSDVEGRRKLCIIIIITVATSAYVWIGTGEERRKSVH